MMVGAGRRAEQKHQPCSVIIKTNNTASRISCSAVNSVRQHETSNNFENCALLGNRVNVVGSD
jgi:hypothetical protein